ncbi:MAG: hypothetical protein NZ828_00665 [Alphaproteobacteria bacterium]|nr:hypothetical protein [Alphaproteobacteria bacterium]MCS5595744.1 hypothetical protein [Alphaproteobacteria bacterium]
MLHHSSPDNQPKFDMIESAGTGYHYLFTERQYLIKLIAAPFIIKFVTILILSLLNIPQGHYAGNIALLPSIFAEGWLYAQVTRSFLFNERWPVMLSGEKDRDTQKLNNRQTCILAAIITYALIHLAFYGVQSLMYISEEDFQNLALVSAGETLPEGTSVSFTPAVTALIILVTAIFWFPLLWIYIAPAANIYFKDFYMTAIKQRLVFKMIACYMICLIPFIAALSIVRGFLVTALAIDAQNLSSAEQILVETITQFTALLIGIVSTVAMTEGMRGFFDKNKNTNTEKQNEE